MPGPLAFRVEFSSEQCRATVLVNDVPVEQTERLVPIDSSAPATPWLKQGRNRLALLIEPVPRGRIDARTEASVTLAVHPLGDYPAGQRPIAGLGYDGRLPDPFSPGSPPGAGVSPVTHRPVDGGGLLLEREVDIAAPIPHWAWLASEPMTDSAMLRAAVRAMYEQIADRVAARDSAFLRTLLRERTAEYRAALHADADDIPDDYGISRLEADAGKTYPLEWEDAVFRLTGNGRLVEYVRWDGQPLIAVDLPVGALYLSFVFRSEKARLIVTR